MADDTIQRFSPFSKMAAALDKLAHEIAEDDCVGAIEAQCVQHTDSGNSWYDTLDTGAGCQRFVNRAVLYLEGVDLLIRHPKHKEWVRVRYAEPEPAPQKAGK